MDGIIQSNTNITTALIYVCAALSVALIVLAIIVFLNARSLSRIDERYRFFMGENSRGDISLEKLLYECLDEAEEQRSSLLSIRQRLSAVENQLPGCFQKIGVVRYNPFDDTGGDLSYAIAILDETNTGFIINGIYSRGGSYSYAKEIENGVSEKYKLSPEELEALQKAVSCTVGSRKERN